ncbi:hypothetical protein GGR53DRAFT_476573 [Hypoxylon sp. FL1150]|nr:hypothetical protein GGR53DRAFT_476573 [Hypoxylon sp. FL1150]
MTRHLTQTRIDDAKRGTNSEATPLLMEPSNPVPLMSGPVHTCLDYLERKDAYFEPGGAPYYVNYPVQGIPQTNVVHQPHPVLIRDLRHALDRLDIDTHGFKLMKSQTSLAKADFEDDDVIRNKYYPEVKALLKEALGAREVYIWEHTVRNCFPTRPV